MGEKRFRTLAEMNKAYMLCALRRSGGDRAVAAKMLGIGRATLYRKLSQLPLADYLALRKTDR